MCFDVAMLVGRALPALFPPRTGRVIGRAEGGLLVAAQVALLAYLVVG